MQTAIRGMIAIATIATAGCASNQSKFDQASDILRKAGGSIYSPPYYLNEETCSNLPHLTQTDRLLDVQHHDELSQFYGCLGAVNRIYQKYIDALTEGRAVVNVYYDTLNLGLTGAAAVFTPLVTKTALSGLSTFFQGQKQSIDKNIFDDKAVFALTSIMEVRRSAVLLHIRSRLTQADYTMGEALLDVDDLYKAGTLQTSLLASYLNQPGQVQQTQSPAQQQGQHGQAGAAPSVSSVGGGTPPLPASTAPITPAIPSINSGAGNQPPAQPAPPAQPPAALPDAKTPDDNKPDFPAPDPSNPD